MQRDSKESPGMPSWSRNNVFVSIFIVGETATMPFVSGWNGIGLQRVAKDLPKYIAPQFRDENCVVGYTSVERGRARDTERERMRQWDPTRRMSRTFSRCSDKVCNEDGTGMSRRANNASACRLAASARFFLDPRVRIKLPASSVRCQEIYLRRRHHVFGRPRPAANNSYLPFIRL